MDGWDSGWLGPLPTSTSICYSCPTPNAFTSTTAIFWAFEPPTQPAACTCYPPPPFCKLNLIGQLYWFLAIRAKTLLTAYLIVSCHQKVAFNEAVLWRFYLPPTDHLFRSYGLLRMAIYNILSSEGSLYLGDSVEILPSSNGPSVQELWSFAYHNPQYFVIRR